MSDLLDSMVFRCSAPNAWGGGGVILHYQVSDHLVGSALAACMPYTPVPRWHMAYGAPPPIHATSNGGHYYCVPVSCMVRQEF